MKTAELFDGYGSGKINAWWLRWEGGHAPGRWSVYALWGRECMTQQAVIDDFGSLVAVPE